MDDSRKDAPDFDLSPRRSDDEQALQLNPSDLNPPAQSDADPSRRAEPKTESAPARPAHSALDAQLFNALVSPKAPITLTRQAQVEPPTETGTLTPSEPEPVRAAETEPEVLTEDIPPVLRFAPADEAPAQMPTLSADDDWEPLPPEVILAEQLAAGNMSVTAPGPEVDEPVAAELESEPEAIDADEVFRPIELAPSATRDFNFPFSAEPIVEPTRESEAVAEIIEPAPQTDPGFEPELVAIAEIPAADIDKTDADESDPADEIEAESEPVEELEAEAEPEAPVLVDVKPDPESEPSVPAGRTGAWWTIPLMCAGLALVACAVLVPAADENRRATHELAKIEQDVEYFQKQSEVNKEFLDRVSTDPTLAERLAMRQLRMTRADSRIVQMPRKSDPFSMSPYALVSVTPPDPLPEYHSVSGFLTKYFLNPKGQIYFAGLGLLLTAAGVICGGGNGRESSPQSAVAA